MEVNMTDLTEELIYVILIKCFDKEIIPMAICVGEEEYKRYTETHNTSGTRTLVINPTNEKVDKYGDIMDKIYESNYYISEYYDGIPLTMCEEEVLCEAESTFHEHFKSNMNQFMNTFNKNYIKFSKSEMRDIEKMINIMRDANDSMYECDEYYDERFDKLNYKELISISNILG